MPADRTAWSAISKSPDLQTSAVGSDARTMCEVDLSSFMNNWISHSDSEIKYLYLKVSTSLKISSQYHTDITTTSSNRAYNEAEWTAKHHNSKHATLK